ncbi:hypothetical protein BH24DEI2_BH24DEI2_07570 [soil metagenome]
MAVKETEVKESEGKDLSRCEICGSERIHVYPSDEWVKRRALCLQCGAHYDEISGWLDPEACDAKPRIG